MTIFDHVKNLCIKKKAWEDLTEEERSSWESFMGNRILSMDQNYIELVDHIQRYPAISKEMLYKTYQSLLPDGYVYRKYIKSSVKKNTEVVKLVASYFQISIREAIDIIPLISPDQLKEIITPQSESKINKIKTKDNGSGSTERIPGNLRKRTRRSE
jgi:hypothetical protein